MTPTNTTHTCLIHEFFICEWHNTRVSVAESHHLLLTFGSCVCMCMRERVCVSTLIAHQNRLLHAQLHSLPSYGCKSDLRSKSALDYQALVTRILDTLRLLQGLNSDHSYLAPAHTSLIPNQQVLSLPGILTTCGRIVAPSSLDVPGTCLPVWSLVASRIPLG